MSCKKNPLFSILVLFLSLSAHSAPGPVSVSVFAAASLTDVLPKIAESWKHSSGNSVTFSFDATSRLAVQLQEGATADLFFSADSEWMDLLEKNQMIDSNTRTDVLTNEIVLIVPKNASFVPATLEDLRSIDIKKIGMAGENVPVSRYSKASFVKAGIWETVLNKVIRGDNVRTALRWVEEGVVQAGVVYRTDAMVSSKVKIAFPFPPGSYPDITYPAAVLAKTKQAEKAKAFLKFCLSKEAGAIFKKAGFVPLTR